MEKRGLRSAAVVAVWLFVGAISAASAEPVLITGGLLETNGPLGHVDISGTRGFTLEAFTHEVDGQLRLFSCTPCVPGTTSVSLLAGWSGNDLIARATLDGTTYLNVGSLADFAPQASVTFTGMLALPPVTGASVVLTSPFLFTGAFSHYRDTGSGLMLFNETLTGHGITTVQFVRAPDVPDVWQYVSAQYEFSAAPAPVPEPATLLLVSGGLLAGLSRARNRRRPSSARS